MSSRIEQIIDEIDEFIDSCKFQPLSATKIIVNKEEIEELLRELRLKTPDEIKRYQTPRPKQMQLSLMHRPKHRSW